MIAQLFRFVNPFAKFPAPEGGAFLFRWFAFDSDAVWRAGVSRKKRCSECFENSFGWDNIQSFWQILVVHGIRFVQNGENSGNFYCTLTNRGLRAIINCICLRNARTMLGRGTSILL